MVREAREFRDQRVAADLVLLDCHEGWAIPTKVAEENIDAASAFHSRSRMKADFLRLRGQRDQEQNVFSTRHQVGIEPKFGSDGALIDDGLGLRRKFLDDQAWHFAPWHVNEPVFIGALLKNRRRSMTASSM